MDAAIEQNPYLDGEFFAPVRDEAALAPEALRVEGTIPRDFGGIYFRNGPNAYYRPQGRYHWFDGDGMLHALHFKDGRASYRKRWIASGTHSTWAPGHLLT